jgi:hypothetical protein
MEPFVSVKAVIKHLLAVIDEPVGGLARLGEFVSLELTLELGTDL